LKYLSYVSGPGGVFARKNRRSPHGFLRELWTAAFSPGKQQSDERVAEQRGYTLLRDRTDAHDLAGGRFATNLLNRIDGGNPAKRTGETKLNWTANFRFSYQ
jgi:hypothetical protein